jgi:hypothetical protein
MSLVRRDCVLKTLGKSNTDILITKFKIFHIIACIKAKGRYHKEKHTNVN